MSNSTPASEPNPSLCAELEEAYASLPTCEAHTAYSYECGKCADLAFPDTTGYWEAEAARHKAIAADIRRRELEAEYPLPTAAAASDGGPERWWVPFAELDQPSEPPKAFFERDDGRPLLYEKTVSWLYGPPR